MQLQTCRFCHKANFEENKYGMIGYGPRHHAHADCLLKAKGAAIFEKLALWQLESFPYFAAKDAGFENELRAEIAKRAKG